MSHSHFALCPVLAGLALLLALGGCGGRDGAAGQRVNAPHAPASRAVLPDIAGLLERHAAFTEAGLLSQGADYAAVVPSQRVAAVGSDLEFAPAGGGAPDLAYACFVFDVEDYDRDLSLRTF